MHFIQLNTKIYRNTQIYLDKVLQQYELSSGAGPYLFILEKHEGISQNQISKDLGKDKAMSARMITKLIKLDYVYKKADEKDSRAYQLYLTDKAKAILPKIREEIRILGNIITEELSEDEKLIMMTSLMKIFNRTQSLRE